jgi:hypothetical protein
MNRFIIAAALSLITTIATAADTAPLPHDAQQDIDREGSQELALKLKFDSDVAKLHNDLITRLERDQANAMHRSDLDGAEGIKARILALKGTAPAPSLDPTGTWHVSKCNWGNNLVIVRPNGVAMDAAGNKGVWELGKGTLRISWPTGLTAEGPFDTNTTTAIDMVGQGSKSFNYTLTKDERGE